MFRYCDGKARLHWPNYYEQVKLRSQPDIYITISALFRYYIIIYNYNVFFIVALFGWSNSITSRNTS